MNSILRKLTWWARLRQKEAELRDELQFHLEEEAEERQAQGRDIPQVAARRPLRLLPGSSYWRQ